jgi:uncharacterized repeat protein (TIGR01451 family)
MSTDGEREKATMANRNVKETVLCAVFLFLLAGIWLALSTGGSVAAPITSAKTDDGTLPDQIPLAPKLTLVRPNGGEIWEAGTQEPVLWAFSGLTEDVRLEYSTDGAQSWKTIVGSAPGTAGAYFWTVPEDPSSDAYVRVSSSLDATISDTNDAPFVILTAKSFEDSYATANPANVSGGDMVSYTIVLYESSSARMTLTDTLPSYLTCVPETLQVEPDWKNAAQFVNGDVRWSDLVTRTVPVSIRFQAQVTTTTSTLVIVNPTQVSRNGANPIELTATVIVNGFPVNLPIVIKD